MNKILIIEDDADLRELMVENLKDQEFEIILAESGQIGVEKAQKYLPDVILCDMMMPGLDGYGVFQTLRQNPITVGIPFIFLTAVTNKEEREYAMNLGVDDYLNKPCKVKELLEAIAKVLKPK